MSATPLVFFRRNLIVVPRSLPGRRDAVAAEKSKTYPCAALNYPGAHHHGSCNLQPGGNEPPRQIYWRVPGSNALGCTAKIAIYLFKQPTHNFFPIALRGYSAVSEGRPARTTQIPQNLF
jgi:hypothetical protein